VGEHKRSNPEELKRNAMELLRDSEKSSAEVSKDLNVNPGLLNL
jgi:transposase-like protein